MLNNSVDDICWFEFISISIKTFSWLLPQGVLNLLNTPKALSKVALRWFPDGRRKRPEREYVRHGLTADASWLNLPKPFIFS